VPRCCYPPPVPPPHDLPCRDAATRLWYLRRTISRAATLLPTIGTSAARPPVPRRCCLPLLLHPTASPPGGLPLRRLLALASSPSLTPPPAVTRCSSHSRCRHLLPFAAAPTVRRHYSLSPPTRCPPPTHQISSALIMNPRQRAPRPDAIAIGETPSPTALAPPPLFGQSPPGDVVILAPLPTPTAPLPGPNQKGRAMAAGASKKNGARFFPPARPHVEESAPPASAATIMHTANARAASSGMEQMLQPEKTSTESWSPQMASHSATISNCQRAAHPRSTSTGTPAPDAEKQAMGPKSALEPKRRKATSPYARSAWGAELARLGLIPRYPSVVKGLEQGFNLGIPPIRSTFTPPNHPSIIHMPNVYTSTVDNEFAAGRYVGPFSRAQLEGEIGPFQTSPLSFVPKTSKPGKFRAVHNFSFPPSAKKN
jgi:hypothetical protein